MRDARDARDGDVVNGVVALADRLLERGLLALSDAADRPDDAALAAEAELARAGLFPGVEAILGRFARGRELLQSIDGGNVERGELLAADALGLRDRIAVRLAALDAVRAAGPAAQVRSTLSELDAGLQAWPRALEDLAIRRDAALAASGLGDGSIWAKVPELTLVEPDIGPAGLDLETLAEDLDAFFSVPPGLSPLLLLRAANDPVAAVPLAAGWAGGGPRYEPPPPEALVHVFGGGAQVFALQDAGRWLVLVYPERDDPQPRVTGPLADSWTEKHCVGALFDAGRAEVHLGDETLALDLTPLTP